MAFVAVSFSPVSTQQLVAWEVAEINELMPDAPDEEESDYRLDREGRIQLAVSSTHCSPCASA